MFLLDLDLHVVERAQVEDLRNEQVLQLIHARDADAILVGQLVGAAAIVVGEVQQWERRQQERTSSVTLSLSVVEVETGRVLVGGQGHLTDPASDNPEYVAWVIVNRVLTLFGVQTHLIGSGYHGVLWRQQDEAGQRYDHAEAVRPSWLADKARLKIGDRVAACNGVSLSQVQTE